MFKDGLLAGKRIGLGREIAARYLALGAELWLAGRRGGVLEAAARELGGNVKTHAVDIRDAAAGWFGPDNRATLVYRRAMSEAEGQAA